MEYIIFLVTIQLPFLYLIWKFFQKRNMEINNVLRNLKKQNEHIANFMDTLRMSVEKISEDLYGQGKVNARMFKIEKNIQDIKENLRQMELYTGLNTNSQTIKDLSDSASLQEKDFR